MIRRQPRLVPRMHGGVGGFDMSGEKFCIEQRRCQAIGRKLCLYVR